MLWFFLFPIIARALGRFQANFITKFTRTLARGDMPSRTHPNTACHESSNSPRTLEAEAHSVASLLRCRAGCRQLSRQICQPRRHHRHPHGPGTSRRLMAMTP
jgi:hypothetical protein